MSAILKKGWGYWDVTNYGYGGCFKRAGKDEECEIIGPGNKGDERQIKFPDGRIAHAPKRGIELPAVAPGAEISLATARTLSRESGKSSEPYRGYGFELNDGAFVCCAPDGKFYLRSSVQPLS